MRDQMKYIPAAVAVGVVAFRHGVWCLGLGLGDLKSGKVLELAS